MLNDNSILVTSVQDCWMFYRLANATMRQTHKRK